MIYTDNRLLRAGLVGGTLSRHHGDMRQIENQQAAYETLHIPPEKILHFHQTHSDTIIPIGSADDAARFRAAPEQDADAWLFTTSGWGAAIQTADCVPLFLFDGQGRAFALAHCGGRGVVKRLPFQVARALQDTGLCHDIFAWLGPHIQVCCFEVQADVAAQFAPSSLHRKDGKIFVNLNLEIISQLTEAGLHAAHIKTPYYCTCGDEKNFFSWRRDHVRQNLLSFIYKP